MTPPRGIERLSVKRSTTPRRDGVRGARPPCECKRGRGRAADSPTPEEGRGTVTQLLTRSRGLPLLQGALPRSDAPFAEINRTTRSSIAKGTVGAGLELGKDLSRLGRPKHSRGWRPVPV